MVETALVTEQIEDGSRLLAALQQNQVPVVSACWLREADEDASWYLYLVTPLVDDAGGTTAAYRQIFLVLRTLPEPRLESMSIKVISPSSRLGEAISAVQGSRSAGRFSQQGTLFGGRWVSAVHVYAPLRAELTTPTGA